MIQNFILNEEVVEEERRVFVRRDTLIRKRKEIHENPEEKTLCPRCAKPFFESPWHRIRRIDPCQTAFSVCDHCKVYPGFDYRIYDYRKPVLKKDNIEII